MDNINKDALAKQLISLRAAIDAALLLLGFDQGEKDYQLQCDHPKRDRKVLTTMGGPEHWICQNCGFEYKEEKSKEG